MKSADRETTHPENAPSNKRKRFGNELVFDAEFTRKFLEWVEPVARLYFRAEVRGAELLPRKQTLLVSHHDGGMMPIDSMFVGKAWHERFAFRRPLHVLVHDMVLRFARPLSRVGAILADRDNLDRLLDGGRSALIYPGAAHETFRPFWERKTISLGNRTGFVKQALKRRLLVTPVVSAGVHETFVVLSRGSWLAERLRFRQLFRANVFPVVAGLPFGLWLGAFFPQLPLPAKITIQILPPVDLVAEAERFLGRPLKDTDAEEQDVVWTCFYNLRDSMQRALDKLYAERRFPIIG
jgi:1-acyl-sn-glycerol-3-phosphate acyltransferase